MDRGPARCGVGILPARGGSGTLALQELGYRVTYLPVDREGLLFVLV
jgi:hypothetical protein